MIVEELMTIDVRWYREDKTAILITFGEQWHPDEAVTALQTVWEMTESVTDTVHLIYDARSTRVPPNILSYMRRMFKFKHPRHGASLALSNNTMVHIMFEAVHKVYKGVTTHIVKDETELDALLDKLVGV